MTATKATKKFEKKHLKGVLERRKVTAKIKQREQIKNKKKAKRAGDNEFYKGPANSNGTKPNKNVGPKAGEMSVDDFFQGGFEILEKEQQKSAQKKPAAGKLGKRKRGGDVEPREDDVSDSNDSQLSDDGADGNESESEGEVDLTEDFDTGMTKEAMKELAKNDPEFYKFLQEDDPEALEFDENTNFDEIDELSGSDEEEGQPKKKQKKDKKSGKEEVDNELTPDMIAKWEASMQETHSLRAARQVVIAFRCAAHHGDDEASQPKYTITDRNAFDDILKVAREQIPKVLNHHLPVKTSASGKIYVNTETKKFKTLSMLVRSFASSTIHLLGTLSDAATRKLTLESLKPLLPYLLSFRKLLKNLIKKVVGFWSQPASPDMIKVAAFMVMDSLMDMGDKGVREAVLKAAYQGLVQGSRVTDHHTIKGINLMKNTGAQLWGKDQSLGYTTAFTFIRQLAIHLRNSIVNNKNDAFRNVYNWQYVHSLDFWSRVLSEHCSPLKEAEAGKESQLKLLIYPLVQVTLGAMRLIPTALYFPLRFQLMRSLLRLSRATDTYIPLASALLEVLNSNEMKKPPKTSTLKQLDFEVAYKAPKAYLRTRVYQDGVGEQIVELFSEYFVLWSKNIAFPEFSLPVIIMLKRWLKDSRKKGKGNNNTKFSSSLALLVQKLEMNSKFIEEKRAKVDFAPKDRKQVDSFLKDLDWEKTPLGAFVASQRILRAEKAKIMEEARKEQAEKDMEEKQNGRGGDSDDDEGGDSDEQDVDLAHDSDEEMEDEVEEEDSDEEEDEDEEED